MKTTAVKKKQMCQPSTRPRLDAATQKRQHDKVFMQAMNQLIEKHGAFACDEIFTELQ